jgi:CSLREA domain-containing protein
VKRLIPALLAALLVLPAAASADVTVNTQADTFDGACDAPPVGNCSLRDALTDTVSGEVITLPAGTYTVSEELDVDQDQTIRGAGARTTTIRYVNASTDGRVMAVGADLEMSGVRITGGRVPGSQGGGINVQFNATLILMDSAVEDNTADGGGGIFSAGDVDLIRVTLARNHAVGEESQAEGGGLLTGAGTASLENTTVSRNTAVDSFDGSGRGGGIYSSTNLDLKNVTITENTAGEGNRGDGGGLFQNYGVAGSGLSTVAVNTLMARNVGFNCAGTVDHPIDSTNGLSDEAPSAANPLGPSCDAQGDNQLVADARLAGLANNGGPTDTHALLAAGPGIDKGAAVGCPATDQRGVTRPRGAGCDVGAYEFVPPPPAGPPPPDGDEELPPPIPHENVNALPKSGTVKVKLPGSDTFVELIEGQQIPLGTIVDTRKGRVTIVAAAGSGQTADFDDGLFKLSQTKGSKPITVLTLVEKLSCAKKGKATTAAKKKKKRRLWGNGSGRFRTRGKHSAATVVGTKWLVEDKCRSTLTRVVRGKVRVRDFVKKKNVTVKAGKKYVARARP